MNRTKHCKNLVSCDAKQKFELYRNNEVYQKNVKIGEQISILLKGDNIL